MAASLQPEDLQTDLFARLNSAGSEVYEDREGVWNGLVDFWEVLRVAPRRSGPPSFWVMFTQLGYDSGPQFTHLLHAVGYEKTDDDLRLVDASGASYRVEFLTDPSKIAIRDRWLAYKAGQAAHFADVDEALRVEFRAMADAA